MDRGSKSLHVVISNEGLTLVGRELESAVRELEGQRDAHRVGHAESMEQAIRVVGDVLALRNGVLELVRLLESKRGVESLLDGEERGVVPAGSGLAFGWHESWQSTLTLPPS